VARFEVNFTNTLNINDDSDTSVKIYEIWTEMEIDGTVTGNREPVSNETLVQLLLASDASISTYLTLVYEGDENPIATIYRDLPLSFRSSDSSGSFFDNYFSSVLGSSSSAIMPSPQVAGSDGQIQYNNGGVEGGASQFYYDDINHRVGIGTTSPVSTLDVRGAILLQRDGGNQFGLKTSSQRWDFDVDTGANDSLRIRNMTSASVPLIITTSGNVGIGTTNPNYRLCVNGTVRAKEIIVDTGWSDFVFDKNYRLPPLGEVEQFIISNKHLPGIPTEAEVRENGVTLGGISSKLLQKIEELTLYVIDLKKENDSLKAQLGAIQAQLSNGRR
jgi:hypothetical protein